jgi:hypothetical protein
MFNPHEAREDGFAHKLALLFFALSMVLVALFFHYDSALKYWLLTSFGQTVPGTIVALEHAPLDQAAVERRKRENPRNFLKNARTWTRGDTVVIDFRPGDASYQTLIVTLPAELVDKKTGDSIEIVYLPRNPRIAYPEAYLSSFRFDSKVTLAALMIGFILLWLGIDESRAWAGFRNRMRRY